MQIGDRIFEESDNRTAWGLIEVITPDKITIKWDTVGFRGQTHTSFYGDLSAISRFRDCWQVKI